MFTSDVGKLYFAEDIRNAKKYFNIWDQHPLPTIEELESNEEDYIFNRTILYAKQVKSWMIENNIRLLEWTFSGQDLSPIETLWNRMKKKLRHIPVRTIAAAKNNFFSQQNCQTFVDTPVN